MNQRAAFDETIALAEQLGMPELPGNSCGLAHMRDMRARILDSFSEAKLGRWLGWAQAMLVASDVGLSLEDVKQINLRHVDRFTGTGPELDALPTRSVVMDLATNNVSVKLSSGWWRHSNQAKDTLFPNILGNLTLIYVPTSSSAETES